MENTKFIMDAFDSIWSCCSVEEEINKLETITKSIKCELPLLHSSNCETGGDQVHFPLLQALRDEDCICKFINYLFARRYGWRDNGYQVSWALDSKKTPKEEQLYKGKINGYLDLIIMWYVYSIIEYIFQF